MSTKLRRGERCPIHKSFWCCGRQEAMKQKSPRSSSPDTRRVLDEFHPRGFRELCSSRELRRRKMRMLTERQTCFYCELRFEDFRDIVVSHKEPKGMGGARRDDHMDNLTIAHSLCNLENGSKRPEVA